MKIDKSDVIVKTAKGQQIAYDRGAGINLPRRLKTFLLLIDDKCSLDVYQESLKAYGDVEDLVIFLIDSGYIEIKGRKTSKPKPESLANAESHTEVNTNSVDVEKVINDLQSDASHKKNTQHQAESSGTMSSLQFDDLIADISEVVETRMGPDALELLMFLESIETYQGLVSALAHIKQMTNKHTTGSMAFKQIEKVMIKKAA